MGRKYPPGLTKKEKELFKSGNLMLENGKLYDRTKNCEYLKDYDVEKYGDFNLPTVWNTKYDNPYVFGVANPEVDNMYGSKKATVEKESDYNFDLPKQTNLKPIEAILQELKQKREETPAVEVKSEKPEKPKKSKKIKIEVAKEKITEDEPTEYEDAEDDEEGYDADAESDGIFSGIANTVNGVFNGIKNTIVNPEEDIDAKRTKLLKLSYRDPHVLDAPLNEKLFSRIKNMTEEELEQRIALYEMKRKDLLLQSSSNTILDFMGNFIGKSFGGFEKELKEEVDQDTLAQSSFNNIINDNFSWYLNDMAIFSITYGLDVLKARNKHEEKTGGL
ncbi:MAG: hypothetical protein ACE5RJ_04100 [Nitrosopumilaceae archaeon]